MRSKKVVLASAVLGLGLAGCGAAQSAADGGAAAVGSAPSTSPAPSPTASASAAPQQTASITKEQARTLAVAGTLKPSDVPGYEYESEKADADEEKFAAAVYKCLAAPAPDYLLEDPGLAFTKGGIQVYSSVDVLSTADEALADLKLAATKKGADCFAKTYRQDFENDGLAVAEMAIDLVPTSITGADGAFAYRLSMQLVGPGGRVGLVGWTAGAVVHGAQISVSVSHLDGSTPTLKRATDLLEIAVERARKAATGGVNTSPEELSSDATGRSNTV
ncbi:MAG: hypothetical protein ACT4QF_03290 [Sporichthyaceae bacterium]